MSVSRAQREVSAREFYEWQAYDSICPIGELRADYRAAMICQILAVTHGDGKRTPSVEDFLLKFGSKASKPKKSLTANAMALAFRMGGETVVDKRGSSRVGDS